MKQKVKSAAKKRIKVTGSGKLFRAKAGRKHLLSSKTIRSQEYNTEVSKGHAKNIKKAMPGIS